MQIYRAHFFKAVTPVHGGNKLNKIAGKMQLNNPLRVEGGPSSVSSVHVDRKEPPATIESVNCALQAYATLPFVSTLILAFVTNQNPPCLGCQYQSVIDAVSIVNAMCMSCALCSISTTMLVIYQTSKLCSTRGPESAARFLEATSLFREIARNSTYLALLLFVLGYGICLAGSSSTGVAWTTSVILVLGAFAVIYFYNSTRALFSSYLHAK